MQNSRQVPTTTVELFRFPLTLRLSASSVPRDICICAILKSGLRPFAIPQNGFSKMPVSNVNQPLQCLFLILLPILQFNQPELTKIPLGAC
jgi:hypothetical protein